MGMENKMINNKDTTNHFSCKKGITSEQYIKNFYFAYNLVILTVSVK